MTPLEATPRGARLPLTLLTLCLTLAGCSLRYDFSAQECSQDIDCARFDGDGTFHVCQENLCKVAQGVECREDDDCIGTRVCSSNFKCQDRNQPPMQDMDMSPSADMPDLEVGEDLSDMPLSPDMGMPCADNSACIDALGESFLCGPVGVCVDSVDAHMDCKPVYYSRTSGKDNVIVFGTLLPLSEPFGPIIGEPLEEAIKFTLDTINDDGGVGGGRKLAWISCNSQGNAEIATRAAEHLTDTIGTPAIVGPLFSEAFISTVSNVTVSAGTFAITPTGTVPSIDNQRQGNNLVWRNIASDEFQGYGISQRVQELGPSKVLIAFKDDRYGNELQKLVFDNLRGSYSADELKVVKLPNPIDLEDSSRQGITAAYIERLDQVLAVDTFEPQAVIIIGTNEGALALSAYLLTAGTKGLRTTPQFILSHGVVSAMADIGTELDAAGSAGLIPFIEGITPEIIDLGDTTYQEYLRQYSLATDNAQPALVSTTTVDAVMTVAFAIATTQAGEPVTGQKIADGVQRLVDKMDGVPISFFDTSFVSDGVAALQRGDDIDMVGVSGELDYDLTTGEVYTPVVGWRIAKDMSGVYTIERAREMLFPDAPALTNATWMNVPVAGQ